MKQIPELELPVFKITVPQFNELILSFWDKLGALEISGENTKIISDKKECVIKALSELRWELVLSNDIKITLSGRV